MTDKIDVGIETNYIINNKRIGKKNPVKCMVKKKAFGSNI